MPTPVEFAGEVRQGFGLGGPVERELFADVHRGRAEVAADRAEVHGVPPVAKG